jgi:hypothetical protein
MLRNNEQSLNSFCTGVLYEFVSKEISMDFISEISPKTFELVKFSPHKEDELLTAATNFAIYLGDMTFLLGSEKFKLYGVYANEVIFDVSSKGYYRKYKAKWTLNKSAQVEKVSQEEILSVARTAFKTVKNIEQLNEVAEECCQITSI